MYAYLHVHFLLMCENLDTFIHMQTYSLLFFNMAQTMAPSETVKLSARNWILTPHFKTNACRHVH